MSLSPDIPHIRKIDAKYFPYKPKDTFKQKQKNFYFYAALKEERRGKVFTNLWVPHPRSNVRRRLHAGNRFHFFLSVLVSDHVFVLLINGDQKVCGAPFYNCKFLKFRSWLLAAALFIELFVKERIFHSTLLRRQ